MTGETRFVAEAREGRIALVVDAILAHRRRGSPFLTVEAGRADRRDGDDREAEGDGGDPEANATSDRDGDAEDRTDDDAEDRTGDPPPWVQYDAADGLCNLDCTDAELTRLRALLDEYPEARVAETTSPGDVAATNVRVAVRTGDRRLAALIEDLFRSVYGRPADYRLWAVAV